MSTSKEHKPHSQPLRLTDDGELWGLPTAESVLAEKALQQQAADERKKVIENLQKNQEAVMGRVMQRLTEVNDLYQKKIFFEMAKGEEKVLISRSAVMLQTETGREYFYLVIGKQGFYGLRYPEISEDQREKQWLMYDKFREFCSIINWESKIEFNYQYVGIYDDELRIATTGRVTTKYGSDLMRCEADIPLLTEADESLIQTCLDHALAIVKEDQQKTELQAEKEEEQIIALQEQVALAKNIQALLPETTQPETTSSIDSTSWFGRFLQKKKKR